MWYVAIAVMINCSKSIKFLQQGEKQMLNVNKNCSS